MLLFLLNVGLIVGAVPCCVTGAAEEDAASGVGDGVGVGTGVGVGVATGAS